MVIFCKTYHKDVNRLEVLLESIDRHNVDDIPVVLCIDYRWYDAFNQRINTSKYEVYTDRDLMDTAIKNKDYEPKELIRTLDKWQIQQIIKFEFCKNMYYDDCLIIDSDCEFIKDFRIKDFYDSDNNLYTVMTPIEDICKEMVEDLKDESMDYSSFVRWMMSIRLEVQKQFKREGITYEFGPPPVLWSKKVVNDFYNDYLIANKKSFVDIIKYAPIEYNWYGEWLLKSNSIPIKSIGPLFKNITSEEQYNVLKEYGTTRLDFAERFFGINMQSNWAVPKWNETKQIDEGLYKYEL